MVVSPDEFRTVMSQFAASVTVVTTVDPQGRRWGLTVTAFASLSLAPPLCLVCIDSGAGSCEALKASGTYAVNFLSETQERESNHFASRVDDKFADVSWRPGPGTGCPLLSEALASIECEVTDIHTGGDHEIFVGRIVTSHVGEGRPLLYWNGAYGDVTSRTKDS